jgi:hypothetical protein
VRTYISLSNTQPDSLPPTLRDDDVRYPPSLVEHFLQEYTRPGDKVIDPFAGYGTTLMTAESMNRIAFGVELNEAKVNFARHIRAVAKFNETCWDGRDRGCQYQT